MASLTGETIASSYDLIVKRHETYSQTGTNIELMTDSNGATAATGLYLESGAVTSNVGIGVSDPAYLLEVKKASGECTVTFGSGNNNQITRLSAGSESHDSKLHFSASESDKGSIIYDHHATAATQKMQFLVGDNAVTAATILGNGNVGIGDDSPNARLSVSPASHSMTTISAACLGGISLSAENDVADNDFYGALHWYNNDAETLTSSSPTDASERIAGAIVCQAAEVTNAENKTGADMRFYTHQINTDGAPAERMCILQSGNVGIGVAEPAALLHVEEDTANESCTVKIKNASSNGAGEGGNIICDTGGTTHCIVGGYYNGTAMAGVLGMTDDAGNFAYFYHDDDGENSLRASENNTHIGTTAPNGQLIADQSSDERVKTISSGTFPYGLEEVNKLTPIKYKLKKKIRDKSVPKKIIVKEKEVDNPEYNKVIGWEDNSDAPYKLGLGAQSTIPHIPEPFSDTGMYVDGVSTKYAMAYWQMIPVLVKAIQELSAKVTALENA